MIKDKAEATYRRGDLFEVNKSDTGGTLTVSGGGHSANIALLAITSPEASLPQPTATAAQSLPRRRKRQAHN